MNILKKSIAPITDEAWKEITEQAEKIFKIHLTARQFVDIDGPNGLEMGAISTGRLHFPDDKSKTGVNYGIREVIPLIEVRKPFKIELMELDNIDRGSKDADLGGLENAAIEIAMFEEQLIYKGFKDLVKGLEESSEHAPVSLPDEPEKILKTLGDQVHSLQKEGVGGPFTLIVNEEKWKSLTSMARGYPLLKQLQQIINGKIIVNYTTENSILVTEREGDYELVLGQDMSIGYDDHDTREVKLYFTESFTFRVYSPEAIRVFKNA
ncbi:MAG: family 1 encapsulin nanocompartment shell protein [Bacteroidota bacterium]